MSPFVSVATCIRYHHSLRLLTLPVQGTRVTFPKEGDQGPNNIPADVVFVIKYKEHPRFVREVCGAQTMSQTCALSATSGALLALRQVGAYLSACKFVCTNGGLLCNAGWHVASECASLLAVQLSHQTLSLDRLAAVMARCRGTISFIRPVFRWRMLYVAALSSS